MKVTSNKYHLSFFLIGLLFISNLCLQSFAIGKQVRPDTDEGVYLYQSKLITQGYVPYKDFAMTSHLPFLTYINAYILQVCHFDMLKYHDLYIFWVFLSIFPLFYTVLHLTRSKSAGIFSVILFSSFAELVQWDSHFFAIRQASLPFFAWFIYSFFVTKKKKISQVFLALFSFCLITNFFISALFLFVLFFSQCKKKRYIFVQSKVFLYDYWLFILLTGVYFCIVLLIPRSIPNILGVQQRYVPVLQRLQLLWSLLSSNWPIFIFGFLGIFCCWRKYFLLSSLACLSFSICFLASSSFYTHYLVLISLPFAIMGGVFFKTLFFEISIIGKRFSFVIKCGLIFFIGFSLFTVFYPTLFRTIALETTPDFFQIVSVLKQSPEPLFAFEPIYAMYAHKNLVMYYNTANMRVFRATGTNLSEAAYRQILQRSKTVLLEPFAESMLPESIKEAIYKNYSLTYSNNSGFVYIRK